MYAITLNELVQPLTTFYDRDIPEYMWVQYSPLDNKPVISVTATINIRGREVAMIYGGGGLIVQAITDKPRRDLLKGRFLDDGSIFLLWKKFPGPHFLSVSYDWDHNARPVRVNWLQEGF
jgi:hypothetical protein